MRALWRRHSSTSMAHCLVMATETTVFFSGNDAQPDCRCRVISASALLALCSKLTGTLSGYGGWDKYLCWCRLISALGLRVLCKGSTAHRLIMVAETSLMFSGEYAQPDCQCRLTSALGLRALWRRHRERCWLDTWKQPVPDLDLASSSWWDASPVTLPCKPPWHLVCLWCLHQDRACAPGSCQMNKCMYK